jgi:hypothetical protein
MYCSSMHLRNTLNFAVIRLSSRKLLVRRAHCSIGQCYLTLKFHCSKATTPLKYLASSTATHYSGLHQAPQSGAEAIILKQRRCDAHASNQT